MKIQKGKIEKMMQQHLKFFTDKIYHKIKFYFSNKASEATKISFDGKIRIYPTLRCNLQCPYCSNFLNEKYTKHVYHELTKDDWLKIIEKVNRDVIITGGEPFLFPHLEELIQAIPSRLHVSIYTNMTLSPKKFIETVKRPVFFLGSYHPSHIPRQRVKDHVLQLASCSNFSGVVHTVNNGYSAREQAELLRDFSDIPWNFFLDQDQRKASNEKVSQKVEKSVLCRNRIILVGPDGFRYPCMRHMLEHSSQKENLLLEELSGETVETHCSHWGTCSYCDNLIEQVVETEKS